MNVGHYFTLDVEVDERGRVEVALLIDGRRVQGSGDPTGLTPIGDLIRPHVEVIEALAELARLPRDITAGEITLERDGAEVEIRDGATPPPPPPIYLEEGGKVDVLLDPPVTVHDERNLSQEESRRRFEEAAQASRERAQRDAAYRRPPVTRDDGLVDRVRQWIRAHRRA